MNEGKHNTSLAEALFLFPSLSVCQLGLTIKGIDKRLTRRIPSGLVVMTLAFRMEVRGFESAARRMLLSQTGFETMKPALPAKAVGPQPANVPLNNCLQLISQLACLRCKDLDRQTEFILTDSVGLAINSLVRSRA